MKNFKEPYYAGQDAFYIEQEKRRANIEIRHAHRMMDSENKLAEKITNILLTKSVEWISTSPYLIEDKPISGDAIQRARLVLEHNG